MTLDEVKNALDLKKALGLEEIIPLNEKEFIVRWDDDCYAITDKITLDSETYWYSFEEFKPVLEAHKWFAKTTF